MGATVVRPGLRRQPPPGAKPRLSADQLAELQALLAQGTQAFGFIGEVWTSKRVAALIKRLLGVTYHRAHVSRLGSHGDVVASRRRRLAL